MRPLRRRRRHPGSGAPAGFGWVPRRSTRTRRRDRGRGPEDRPANLSARPARPRDYARNVLPVPPLVEKTATTTPVGPFEPLALAVPRMPPLHSTARRSASLNSFLPFVRSTTSRTPPRTRRGNEPSTGTSRTRSTAVAADSRAENSASAIASSSPTDGARRRCRRAAPFRDRPLRARDRGQPRHGVRERPQCSSDLRGERGRTPNRNDTWIRHCSAFSDAGGTSTRTGSGAGASARRGPAPARG